MTKALVSFASLTGNTEEMAEILADELSSLGVDTRLEECSTVLGSDFEAVDICVVATYTYGVDAEIPDEMLDLYEDLETMNLNGKVFATLGSGDHYYPKFCQSVDDFTERFLAIGAKQVGDPIKAELYPEPEDIEAIKELAQKLVNAVS